MGFDRHGPQRDSEIAKLLARVKALEDRNVGIKQRGEIEPVWKFRPAVRPWKDNGNGTYTQLVYNNVANNYTTYGSPVPAQTPDALALGGGIVVLIKEKKGQTTAIPTGYGCVVCKCFPLDAYGTIKKNEPGSTFSVTAEIKAQEDTTDPDRWRSWLRFDLSSLDAEQYVPVAAAIRMKVKAVTIDTPDDFYNRFGIGPLHDNSVEAWQTPGTVGATLDATSADFNILDDICEPFVRKLSEFAVGDVPLFWFDCLRLIRSGGKVEFGLIIRENGTGPGAYGVEFETSPAPRLWLAMTRVPEFAQDCV